MATLRGPPEISSFDWIFRAWRGDQAFQPERKRTPPPACRLRTVDPSAMNHDAIAFCRGSTASGGVVLDSTMSHHSPLQRLPAAATRGAKWGHFLSTARIPRVLPPAPPRERGAPPRPPSPLRHVRHVQWGQTSLKQQQRPTAQQPEVPSGNCNAQPALVQHARPGMEFALNAPAEESAAMAESGIGPPPEAPCAATRCTRSRRPSCDCVERT